MKAADRFHVPPWELLAQGDAWLQIAIAMVNAENTAANEIRLRAERRARMQQRAGGRR